MPAEVVHEIQLPMTWQLDAACMTTHAALCIMQGTVDGNEQLPACVEAGTCGTGGFAFGYWASKFAGLPEKAARTNSIEVGFLNLCLPILARQCTVHRLTGFSCTNLLACLWVRKADMCRKSVHAAVHIPVGVLVACMLLWTSLCSTYEHPCIGTCRCLVFLDRVYPCCLLAAESTSLMLLHVLCQCHRHR